MKYRLRSHLKKAGLVQLSILNWFSNTLQNKVFANKKHQITPVFQLKYLTNIKVGG